jgi:hypothetical protein
MRSLDYGSRIFVALLALTSACLGPARSARATVVQTVSFDAQCATADRIFVGAVRAVESRRNAARPRYFETLVTFGVEEVVDGSVPPVLELRFTGGRVGDVVQSIDGMPEFAVGERYVVFADANGEPPLVSPIVGFNQGLYRVVREESGGGLRDLVRDRVGAPLADSKAAYGSAVVPGAGPSGGPGTVAAEPELDAFLAAIRAARRR